MSDVVYGVLAVVFLVLYVRRRRARLSLEN
jgi:hypothetical protein